MQGRFQLALLPQARLAARWACGRISVESLSSPCVCAARFCLGLRLSLRGSEAGLGRDVMA